MIRAEDLYFWTCGKCGYSDNWTFASDSDVMKRIDQAIEACKALVDDFPEIQLAIRAMGERQRTIRNRACQACKAEIEVRLRSPVSEDLRTIARLLGMGDAGAEVFHPQ